MSKIEDALNKAKNSQSGSNNLRKFNNIVSVSPAKESDFNKLSAIRGTSVSTDIKLMDCDTSFNSNELSELKIVSPLIRKDKVANSYRDLRTKLLQKSKGDNFIVMITSAVENVNNGLTLINLASAFSFVDTKTSLVIDCNLTHPTLDEKLNKKTDMGLIDYLEDENIDVESIIYSTGIDRLRLIPAGHAEEPSAEYFTSARMCDLMKDLLFRYSDRYIFIHAAPITESADARILSELCDLIILEVPYASSTTDKIKEAVDDINQDKFAGIVFNEIPSMPKLKLKF